MVLQINNAGKPETWIAHFTHLAPITVYRLRPYNMKTVCTLHSAPCPKKERPCGAHDPLQGIAYCSLKDNFCRATGRKLAFTRAVMTLPRALRRELWIAFFINEKKLEGQNGQTCQVPPLAKEGETAVVVK